MANLINMSPMQQQPQQSNQHPMMMMRGGNISQAPQVQPQQDPLGSSFMNMVQQQRGGQPEPGSLVAQFQLGKDYQNLGMDFQNAFSQTPQQVNPLGAFFMQNRPQSPLFNSFQNVMNNQNNPQPPMGSIMGVGAQHMQQSQAQPMQQRGGLGFFGGMFGG